MKANIAVLIAFAFACGSQADAQSRASEVDQSQRAGQGRAWHNQRGHGVRDNGVPLPAQKVKDTPARRVAQPRLAAPVNDLFAGYYSFDTFGSAFDTILAI